MNMNLFTSVKIYMRIRFNTEISMAGQQVFGEDEEDKIEESSRTTRKKEERGKRIFNRFSTGRICNLLSNLVKFTNDEINQLSNKNRRKHCPSFYNTNISDNSNTNNNHNNLYDRIM